MAYLLQKKTTILHRQMCQSFKLLEVFYPSRIFFTGHCKMCRNTGSKEEKELEARLL